MKKDDILIPEILFSYRQDKKISQKELADILGVCQEQISKWETSKHHPSELRKVEIIRILNEHQ